MKIWAPLAAVAIVALAGCGGDDRPEAAARPADLSEVEAVFGPDLAELGLRLTERGGVVDPDDGYAASSSADHLSLYVKPIGDHSRAQYVEGILDTARLLAPAIFERWSAIETFDVCQEPAAIVGEDPNAAALTRLDMTRAQVEAIEWDTVTLPAFLDLASERSEEGVELFVERSIRETDAFQSALADAG